MSTDPPVPGFVLARILGRLKRYINRWYSHESLVYQCFDEKYLCQKYHSVGDSRRASRDHTLNPSFGFLRYFPNVPIYFHPTYPHGTLSIHHQGCIFQQTVVYPQLLESIILHLIDVSLWSLLIFL